MYSSQIGAGSDMTDPTNIVDESSHARSTGAVRADVFENNCPDLGGIAKHFPDSAQTFPLYVENPASYQGIPIVNRRPKRTRSHCFDSDLF